MLRNLLHILLAAWIVMASGGYGVFEHICHCSGTSDVSFVAEHHCDSHAELPSSTDTKEPSCCQGGEEPSGACPTGLPEKCCDTRKLAFLKTNDFTAPSSVQEVNAPITVVVIQYVEFELDAPESENQVLANDSSPPINSRHKKAMLLRTGAFHSSLS